MFPKVVTERVSKDYIENKFSPLNHKLLAETLKKLDDLQKSDDKLSDDLQERINSTLEKENLQAQYELLKSAEQKVSDLGPTFDCIVFNDGQYWKYVFIQLKFICLHLIS